jgi:hypothetical protein
LLIFSRHINAYHCVQQRTQLFHQREHLTHHHSPVLRSDTMSSARVSKRKSAPSSQCDPPAKRMSPRSTDTPGTSSDSRFTDSASPRSNTGTGPSSPPTSSPQPNPRSLDAIRRRAIASSPLRSQLQHRQSSDRLPESSPPPEQSTESPNTRSIRSIPCAVHQAILRQTAMIMEEKLLKHKPFLADHELIAVRCPANAA